MNVPTDTIVAPATASGGAIAVIRLSGPEAIACCDRIFRGRKPLAEAAGHTLHYGEVIDGDRMIDDVVAAIYRAPHSYTGEDAVELSCHGSHYIVSEIIALLLRSGARMAQPGEFTIRAFLAGRMDLAQAEAVADLIASDSRASHAMASTQMRGGYSAALGALRNELLQLASLLELELDFSEEDVQFADRARLREMMHRIESEITRLTDSFRLGNAIKKGVAVAIVGEPNVGKSTLLNRLLGEERALVSDIAGTTRDTIEETLNIDGVLFRFIDTAGLHDTADRLEQMGIDRTQEMIRRAQIVLQVVDATCPIPPYRLRPNRLACSSSINATARMHVSPNRRYPPAAGSNTEYRRQTPTLFSSRQKPAKESNGSLPDSARLSTPEASTTVIPSSRTAAIWTPCAKPSTPCTEPSRPSMTIVRPTS